MARHTRLEIRKQILTGDMLKDQCMSRESKQIPDQNEHIKTRRGKQKPEGISHKIASTKLKKHPAPIYRATKPNRWHFLKTCLL